jgi:CRISPR system Cascade subunit CasA
LFGQEQRFIQLLNLQPGKETDDGNPATKLDLALATGNNSTLFDNRAGENRSVIPARAAINLLVFQCFAPGGRIGVARWNNKETAGKGSSNHAPCTPSSMIHTFILGSNIAATIRLNLLTKIMVADAFPAGWGVPVWEDQVLKQEDSKAIRNATLTFLGRLVPLSRAIRLADDGSTIILANGLDYPIFPAFREATATIVQRKDELGLLPASTGRSLWRQLPAIAVKRRAGSDQISGPLALGHDHSAENITLWVGALVTNKAKIEDVLEASYNLPSQLFTEFGKAAYENGVKHAEENESNLVHAVKVYATALKIAAPANDRVRQHFWTRVEQNLSSLFDVARSLTPPDQLQGSDWGRAVRAAALDAYEQSCPRQTPRQIQAVALGLRQFNSATKSAKTKETIHE